MKYRTVVFLDPLDGSILTRHYYRFHTEAELLSYTKRCLGEYFDDLVLIGFAQDRDGSDVVYPKEAF